jgi:hypothetical protein
MNLKSILILIDCNHVTPQIVVYKAIGHYFESVFIGAKIYVLVRVQSHIHLRKLGFRSQPEELRFKIQNCLVGNGAIWFHHTAVIRGERRRID